MTCNRLAIVLVAIVAVSAGCQEDIHQVGQGANGNSPPTRTITKVREAAVAGMFYPDDPQELAELVDRLLDEAAPEPVKNLRGLVCPHAGYPYSGQTAALAYKLLAASDFDTVVVMAPSHYTAFKGASITDVDAYRTPLGTVALSPRADELAAKAPFVRNPSCEAVRPDWWRQAPKELPPFGQDTPHTFEHSLEVQLPFLQRALGDFSVVPIVFGDVNTEQVASKLAAAIDDKTLLVASSDLSHQFPYDTANRLDASCVNAICKLDTKQVEKEEACGKTPILTLMHVAKQKGWKTKLLDYRNSGDVTGNKLNVVGYAAVAFFDPEGVDPDSDPSKEASDPSKEASDPSKEASDPSKEASDPSKEASDPSKEASDPSKEASESVSVMEEDGSADDTLEGSLTADEGELLLKMAEKAVTQAVTSGPKPSADEFEVPESFHEHRACFVTLTKNGRLRGCIGSIFPQEPLCRAVIHRALSAATEDPRFPRVLPSELDELRIEVSVLSVPSLLKFDSPRDLIEKLRPNVDGVVLMLDGRQSTYLPQVWQTLPEPARFLSQLSQKAGLSADGWKDPRARILTYQVQAFHQPET